MQKKHRTISGKCLGSLPILKKVLNAWINNNIRCAEYWNGKDVPWWYNERALLSILAGAVWRKKGIAFEEFSAEKKRRRRNSLRNKFYPGRQDIYIKIGKFEFIGEAKETWSGATLKNIDSAENITNEMLRAISDIRKSRPEGKRRLAIVFAKVYIGRTYLKLVDKCINTWLGRVKRHVDYSCCAWVFPAASRTFMDKDKYIYPGVMLFIRKI